MSKLIKNVPDIVAYFFILLFCYAAISKLTDFENFQVQIAQSPLISAYADFISYSVIISELIITALLAFPRTRLLGLYSSLFLMASFTIYIYLILNYSDFIPCSCGGILQKMSWVQHLIFNIASLAFAIVAIALYENEKNIRSSRYILKISLTTIFGFGLVIYVFLTSEYIIKKENNFTRRFIPSAITENKIRTLESDTYYFAGIEDGNLYLGDKIAPLFITKIDTSLTGISKRKIALDNLNYPFRNLQLQVKKPYYYLHDGSIPVIYRGHLNSSTAKTLSYNEIFFNQFAVLDSNQFAFRTISSKNKQFTIAGMRLHHATQTKIDLYPYILQKQKDGIFDADGKLIYDAEKSNPIYVHTYRNQIIVMNQSLNVLRRLHTIDTTSVAQIKIQKLKNGSHKMTAPPLKINKIAAAYGGILFIQSNLIGKHESPQTWRRASIIDMYKLEKQEYLGSFYIYNRDENSVSSMLISGKNLYVLIGKELIKYRFNHKIAESFHTGVAENLNKSRH